MTTGGKPLPGPGSPEKGKVLLPWFAPDRWPRWLIYVFAVTSVAATLMVRLAIGEFFLHRPVLILFFLPIILNAYLGGLGPGLVATLLAALGTYYFLVPPTYSISISKTADLFQWAILVVNGAGISILCEALHRFRRQVEDSQLLQAVTLTSIGDGVITTDQESRITFLNAEAERLTGWRLPEALGQPLPAVFRIVNEQTREALENPVKEVLAAGTVVGLSNHALLLARDGREVAIADSGAPIKHPDGRILGVVLVFRDCTEERRTEEALRESEARLRLFIEYAPAALAMLDRDMRYLSVSRRWLTDYGLGDRDIIGLSHCEVFPDIPERWKEVHRRGLAGEVVGAEADRFERADGSVLFQRWEVRPWFDASGSVAGIVIFTEDTTARQQAEVALRRSEAHYRLLHNTMVQGVVFQDAEGKIISMNPAAERILGKSPADFLGQTSVSVEYHSVRPDGSPFPGQEHPSMVALRTGQEVHDVVMGVFNPREQGYRWININAAPLVRNPGESPYQVYTVFEDITVRRQAEERLSKSLAEKTALLKEVHHRVKNNLQIVASLLKLQASRSPLPGVAEVLDDTRKRVHSMALLHETLYRSDDLARINFAAYVKELCRHLQRSAGPVGARVELETRVFPLGLPMEHSLPCGLIINELVSNALKHAFPGDRRGKITVSLELVPEQKLLLRLADNGIGMPSGLELAATPTLGLRLASGLASQLGGELAMEPREGGGTVFQVAFPAPHDAFSKDNLS